MSFIKLIIYISIMLALISCGGGGGSSDSSSNIATNHAPTLNIAINSSDISGLDSVELTVTASDSDGDVLTYSWSQTSSNTTQLDLSNVDSAGNLQLIMPDVISDETYSITLAVSDGKTSTSKATSLDVKVLPPFSFTVASNRLEVGENEEAIFELIYSNARGAVVINVNVGENTFEGEYSLVHSNENATVTLLVPDINIPLTLPIVVSATDSAEIENSITLSVDVINTSMLVQLAEFETIQSNLDTILAAEEEQAIIIKSARLAYYAGNISKSEEKAYMDSFDSLLDLSLSVIIRAESEELAGMSVETSENVVYEKLNRLRSDLAIYIAPTNILLDTVVSLTGILPEIETGKYYFTESLSTYSQFVGNASLGELEESWIFNQEHAFMSDIIFPESQACNAG